MHKISILFLIYPKNLAPTFPLLATTYTLSLWNYCITIYVQVGMNFILMYMKCHRTFPNFFRKPIKNKKQVKTFQM